MYDVYTEYDHDVRFARGSIFARGMNVRPGVTNGGFVPCVARVVLACFVPCVARVVLACFVAGDFFTAI